MRSGVSIAATAAVLALSALSANVWATAIPGQGTWETTLQPRDINSDGKADGYYDTVLNVTWLADAGAWQVPHVHDGLKAWAMGLDVYGIVGWRLPFTVGTHQPGVCASQYNNCDQGFNMPTISADGKTVYSEFAHLYFVTLGEASYCDTLGHCVTGNEFEDREVNTGPFTNMRYGHYQSEFFPRAIDEPYPYRFVGFDNVYGYQFIGGGFTAWAVHSGDVSALPVPELQTYALMFLGLSMLAVATRRRRSH